MKWLRKIIWLAVAGGSLVAMAFGVLGLNSRVATSKSEAAAKYQDAKSEAVVMVTTDLATERPIQRKVSVVGSLYGEDEIGITPKVDGRIVRIFKLVGDSVKPGDVLFEIEERNYQLAIDEAKRALELDLSKIGLKELPSPQFDVRSLPTFAKAHSEEQLANLNYQRLLKVIGATNAERDEARSKLEVAKANSRQTIFDAETALAQIRYKVAQLATAEQKLLDTRVIVPIGKATNNNKNVEIEYVVAERTVSLGETVTSNATARPAYKLVVANPMKMVANVPERHVEEIQVDQPVTIHVESTLDLFTGRVARINPTIDRLSRTFQVEISIPNPKLRLHSGSFAKADLFTRIDNHALTVPDEALVTFGGLSKIYVLRAGRVAEVAVTPGVRQDISEGKRNRVWVEVVGSVQAGESVVTSGQSKLSDGTLAQIRQSSVKKD